MKSTNTGYELRCIINNHLNDERETSTFCTTCGNPLTVIYNEVTEEIQYPLKNAIPDPLKTGPTSVVHLKRLSEQYGAELYGKLEFEHPTGCFKDRGSYVEVQKAIELGVDGICVASTGNMAASVAAYSCYFNVPCYVFVPEKTPPSKLAQATIYGANVIKIKGDFLTCEKLCRAFAKSGNYYLAGDYVFREEGQKSFSYELYEAGLTDFDYIFVPVGAGTNFSAIHKGFKEMKAAGLVTHIPSFVAVQPKQSSPVIDGIFKKEKVIATSVNTMADAVAVGDPFDFYKVLQGIEKTDGYAFTVTENEILDSMREMALNEGIFTETACALPLASLKNNVETFKGKKCLFILTGLGLKTSQIVSKYAFSSPVLSPSVDHVQRYIESGFLDVQKASWGQSRNTVLPNVKMGEEHTRLYEEYVSNINKKGKTLSNSEIEVLHSLVYNEEIDLDYPVQVVDYKITMRKDSLVTATVKLDINGKEVKSKDKGVGPMNAVLSAIKRKTDSIVPLQVMNHEVDSEPRYRFFGCGYFDVTTRWSGILVQSRISGYPRSTCTSFCEGIGRS